MVRIARFVFMMAVLTAMFGSTAARPASAASLTDDADPAHPAVAGVGCLILDVTGPASGYINLIKDHDYNIYLNGVLVSTFHSPITGHGFYSVLGVNHLEVTDASCDTTSFKDGRLNNRDAGQSAAIYCENGGITIYGLYNSIGFVAFKASKAEIARVSATPRVNTKIKSAKGITLWRLTSGEFEVSGPNGYTFIWKGDCSQ
jgi:hypothetical protein